MNKLELVQSLRADAIHPSDQSVQAAYDWGYELGQGKVNISGFSYGLLPSEAKAMNAGHTQGMMEVDHD